MRVLVACEESGRVRNAFLRKGHDAVSLDILPTSAAGPHRQEPLTSAVLAEDWDLIIAFPPCTHLSNISASTWKTKQDDGRQQDAVSFVQQIWNAPTPRLCIENPAGWLNKNWRKPDQIVHPWNFGDWYKKQTCLWLRGLPKLQKLFVHEPENAEYWVTGQRRSKQGGQFDIFESVDRRSTNKDIIRAKTFPGIARAMATNWG